MLSSSASYWISQRCLARDRDGALSVLEVVRSAPVRSTSIFYPLQYLHFFVHTCTSDMLPVLRVKSSGSG